MHRHRTQKIGTLYVIAGLAGVLLVAAKSVHGVAASAQHAPQPSRSASQSAAGFVRPSPIRVRVPGAVTGPRTTGPWLPRSEPVWLDIPAIGVHSGLLRLGLNTDGTMQVPPLFAQPSEAGWYKYSVTPGQIGPSVIVGHVDTYLGPSVFFSLRALRPGNTVDVTLADRTVAIFRVTGVRSYLKTRWPWRTVFGATSGAALRLVTCGGAFDSSTGHYLSSIIVFASLAGSTRAASG